MLLSIIFIVLDVFFSVVNVNGFGKGINPFWAVSQVQNIKVRILIVPLTQLSLVFKCFCDTLILDDFKLALDELRELTFGRQANWHKSQSCPGLEGDANREYSVGYYEGSSYVLLQSYKGNLAKV